MIHALAPVAPPCFQTRGMWLEYLAAYASEQRTQHEPGPLIFSARGVTVATDAGLSTAARGLNVPVLIFKGRTVSFNYAVPFCSDCSTAYRGEMVRAARCDPNHLKTKITEPG